MAKIIDLSVIKKEATTIKINEKESFEISGNVSTGFTLELMEFVGRVGEIEQSINSTKEIGDIVKKSRELIELLKEIVLFIIQQDKKKKNIDIEYINKHIDDVDTLRAILEITMNHIKGIENDPN